MTKRNVKFKFGNAIYTIPGVDSAFIHLENAICVFLYFRLRFTSLSHSLFLFAADVS